MDLQYRVDSLVEKMVTDVTASSKSVHLGLVPMTEVPASLTAAGPKDRGRKASLRVIKTH